MIEFTLSPLELLMYLIVGGGASLFVNMKTDMLWLQIISLSIFILFLTISLLIVTSSVFL